MQASQWRRMLAPNRLSVLISAALAVATPLLAGAHAWRLVDEEHHWDGGDVLLYWPSLLLDQLPPLAAEAFQRSALPTVLLYFFGYLLMCQLARTLWRSIR